MWHKGCVMRKIAIIGGGAAGLMAAVAASKENEVFLFEKNEKLGKKIYITGKGRCNLTNQCDIETFLDNVLVNSKFLYKALNVLSPSSTMEFFNNFGLELKIERGNRVFPLSDKASDVTKTLEKTIKSQGVNVILNTKIDGLVVENGAIKGVKIGEDFKEFDSVILATGGISYPLTGSTGDGYNFAIKLGHNVVSLKPSLVGMELFGNLHNKLQGLSLKNVKITVFLSGKPVYSDFGEMLFTHFGVSGPIILSCSAVCNKLDLNNAEISIDFKPALSDDTLDLRLVREFNDNKNKNLSSVIRSLLPKALVEPFIKRLAINSSLTTSEVTTIKRREIINLLKDFRLKIKGLRPIEEAVVTSGGVNVKEINPKTMESKLVKGLFFAGEVIDVDAFTGGFNLQIAFSTGYLAGLNA